MESEKEIRKKYEEIDDRRINLLKYQKEEARQLQKKSFLEFIAHKKEWFRKFGEARSKALGFKEDLVRTDRYEVNEGFIDIK